MFKVHTANVDRKLRELGVVLRRPLREVLDSGARLMAIEFAKTSQPFGTGAEAQKMGQDAVSRDIARVYATPGKAYEDISNPRVKGAFWKAYKAGEFSVAEQLLNDFGNNLRGVPLEGFDGGLAHRSERNSSTGRVSLRRPKMIVTDPKALARYVEKVRGDVGTGKGGWADVARQISGSIRGLRTEGDITANWITRKGQGYGFYTRSGTDEHPFITIRSAIPYASQILNGTALERSKSIARYRMIENLSTALKHAAANLPRAA